MSPTSTRHPTTSRAVAGGLTYFAAVMLLISGLLDFFRGVMAVDHDDVFVSTPNYVFKFDLTSWGWIHLILGIVAVAVAVGLFMASPWAHALAVVWAGLLLIANFLSLPYHPLWSLVVMALCAFVIWGLCTSGPAGAGK
ncbi:MULTISPECIES: hypothetical protein [Streptomyces]|uniref:DUF7144 domain-containing protein n=1 Tax=Streptomyces luteosporeus TaxID=173856 RepID=A0ABN3TTU5_9ACTN